MRTCTSLLLLPAIACLASCAAANTQQGRAASGPAATAQSGLMCTAGQLALSTGGNPGDFNGMSHSGTLLVLRNTSDHACRLQPFPQITLFDAKGPLQVTFTPPGSRFMHPGPVVLPITIEAGAVVSSPLRWVSGPVYAKNTCVSPVSLHLNLQGSAMKTPMGGTLCGDATKGVQADYTRWQPGTSTSPAQ